MHAHFTAMSEWCSFYTQIRTTLLSDRLAALDPRSADDRQAVGIAYYSAKQQLERSTHTKKDPKLIGVVSLTDWKEMITEAEKWLASAGTSKPEYEKYKECAIESYLRAKADGIKVESPPPAAASPPLASPPPASPPPAANPSGKRAIAPVAAEPAQKKQKPAKTPAKQPLAESRPKVRASMSGARFTHHSKRAAKSVAQDRGLAQATHEATTDEAGSKVPGVSEKLTSVVDDRADEVLRQLDGV